MSEYGECEWIRWQLNPLTETNIIRHEERETNFDCFPLLLFTFRLASPWSQIPFQCGFELSPTLSHSLPFVRSLCSAKFDQTKQNKRTNNSSREREEDTISK